MKILYGFICGILMSCAPFVEIDEAGSIKLKNNSNSEILILTCYAYPDTTITGCIDKHFRFGIESGVLKHIDRWDRESWDIYFKEHEKITVFVFPSHIGDVRYYKDIKESDILKKFIIGKIELDSLGWVLNYP